MTVRANADQIAYWNGEIGSLWSSRAAITERVFAPLTEALLERAAPRPGERIVDIGTGCGGLALQLARGVAPHGWVLGVDVSEPMLDTARRRPDGQDVDNIEFLHADAATHAFEPGAFDLATSQFGVMFFDDPIAAFSNAHRALDGGRLAFACWRAMSENTWQTVPNGAVDHVLPPVQRGDPLAPGPFALADPERVRSILTAAGFHDITLEPIDRALPLGDDPTAAAGTLAGFGTVARRLSGQPDAVIQSALRAITSALESARTPDGVRLGAAIWVVGARA
jgi:SAM-dependent methyltransferase